MAAPVGRFHGRGKNMANSIKKTLAGLLAFCLALSLLYGFKPWAAADDEPDDAALVSEETANEPMTTEKLLELMSVRRYIFIEKDEEGEVKGRVTLTVKESEEDGKTHLYADVKRGTLAFQDIQIDLMADTLEPDPEREGVYIVMGVMPDFEMENQAIFTVADGAVTLIETAFMGNTYACEPETFPVNIAVTGSGELTADPAEPYLGQTVTLTATPADHYRLVSVSVSGSVKNEEKTEDLSLELKEDLSFSVPVFAVTDDDEVTLQAEAVFELIGYWSEEWLAAVEEGKAVNRLPYASSSKYNAILFAMEDRPETLADVAEKVAAIHAAIRAYVESNALAEGFDGSVDVTDRIENAENPTVTEPWTVDGSGALTVAGEWPYVDGEGRSADSYFETDGELSGFDFTMTQELTLEPGEYIFTVKLRGSGAEATLLANGMTMTVTPGEEGGTFTNGWEDYTLEFEVLSTDPVSLGLYLVSTDALGFVDCGDFRLAQVGQIALPETYAVLCLPVDNGSISADKTEAYAGETITLTAEPATGYELASVSAVDENGEAVALDGMSFTMPASTVTLTAEFRKIRYEIRIAPTEHGSIVADKTKAPEGETVTLTAEADEGYVLWQLYVDADSGAMIILDSMSFTMPASPVTVQAVFAQPHAIRIVIDPNANGTVTADRTEAVEGETVKLTAVPDENYALEAFTVLYEGRQIPVEQDGSFVMPAGEVTVSATFKRVAYILSYDANGHGTAPEAQVVPIDELPEEPIQDPSEAGYDFEGWYLDQKGKEAFDFTKPLTEDTTVYAKWVAFSYSFTDGQQKTWQKNGTGSLSFTVKRSAHDDWTYSRFEKLIFDNNELTKDVDFSVDPGSLIITLYSSILNTKAVSANGYELKAVFSDGETAKAAVIKVTSATATPTAKPTRTTTTTRIDSPTTGDNSRIVLWSVISVVSLLALAAVLVTLKKRGERAR